MAEVFLPFLAEPRSPDTGSQTWGVPRSPVMASWRGSEASTHPRPRVREAYIGCLAAVTVAAPDRSPRQRLPLYCITPYTTATPKSAFAATVAQTTRRDAGNPG
jgi:hypothetical protein